MNKEEYKIKKYVINDKNKYLINMYLTIMTNHLELIQHLNKLKIQLNKYDEIKTKPREKIIPEELVENIKSKKEYYYYIRKEFNNNKDDQNKIILTSAYFIFLNKVGFRGLYRENKNGEFNVPYGNYKNPNIESENNICKLHHLINSHNVVFTNKDFMEVIDFKKEEDQIIFTYLDPPYYPINDKSFTAYNSAGFNEYDHKNIIKILEKINNNNLTFLMSNSCTAFITDNMKEYNLEKIICKRRINSTNPEKTEYEILCFNN